MHDLGTLGGITSQGVSINRFGVVVGSSTTYVSTSPTDIPYEDAFITSGDTMIDLNSYLPSGSGWRLADATGINDSGWITGGGYINGQSHAFILRPNAVPEPSAAWGLGIGCCMLGMGLKRRRRIANGASS